MADYPSLEHIPLGDLLGIGDPWEADETLQSGDPGAISELASAFQSAGGCTEETWNEWVKACERFQASWNRETGEYPINNSAEVQRATTQLFVLKDQLPLIGIDLQNLAADLAAAEKESASKIAEVTGKVELLDVWVGQRIEDDESWDDLLDEAQRVTKLGFDDIERIRDQYTDKLEAAATDLRLNHGYDPAGIEDVDGDREAGPEQRGRTGTEHYEANQRDKDEALVNDPGPMTAEKAEAAARLHDYEIATAANVPHEQRELAAQRLDDFRLAYFVGQLPRDPLLGGDARTLAQARLELQRRFEQGALGFPPMTRDQATRAVNNGESFSRVNATRDAYKALTAAGMSDDGAQTFLTAFVVDGTYTAMDGMEGYAANVAPIGREPRPTDLLSPSDARVLATALDRAGTVGDVLQLGVALGDWHYDRSDEDRNEELGGAVGGVLGGIGGTAAVLATAAAFSNPVTAAIVAGVVVYSASKVGESVGGAVGSTFDAPRATVGR